MIKYVKRWVEWCDSCGHGFKVDAEDAVKFTKVKKKSLLQKLRLKKFEEKVETDYFKPDPSSCPVCGKADNVTVIKLQEDKVTIYEEAQR